VVTCLMNCPQGATSNSFAPRFLVSGSSPSLPDPLPSPLGPRGRSTSFLAIPCELFPSSRHHLHSALSVQPRTSNIKPPAPSAPARRSFSAGGPLRNLFVPIHLETKLRSRKNPPLFKPFRISFLQDFERLRPYPPLSKSFVFNTVRKTLQKPPLSNPFGFRWFQTTCKAPLSKPFRITLLHKIYVFWRGARSPSAHSAYAFFASARSAPRWVLSGPATFFRKP